MPLRYNFKLSPLNSAFLNASSSLLKPHFMGCFLALSATVSLAVFSYLPATAAMHPDVAKAYQQGMQAAHTGNLPQADYWLRQAITLDPEDSLLPLQLGQILVDEGQPEKAIEQYRQAAVLNSQDAMIYITLGNLHEQLQQWDLARQAYEAGLRKNPDYRYGLLNLGRVLTQLNDKAKAIDVYKTFLVTYPNNVQAQQALSRLYLVSGQPQQAAQRLDELKTQQGNQFQDALLLSQALLQSKQPQQALMALEQAQRQGDAPADVAESRSKAYLQLGQNEAAIAAMQQALNADPNRNALRLQLGQLYMQSGQPSLAVPVLESYVRLEPAQTTAQWLLAKAYLDTERYKEAVPYLRQLSAAQTQPPLTADALFTARGQLAFALQQSQQPQEAIAIYDTLLRQPAPQAAATDLTLMKKNLALAYFQQGELEKALPLYRELWQQGKVEAATNNANTSASAVTSLTPESYPWLSGTSSTAASPAVSPAAPIADADFAHDYGEVLQTLARQAYSKGQFAEADQLYSEALELDGDTKNVQALLALANTRLAAGRKEEAESLYRQVLATQPAQPEATLYLTQVLLLQNKITPLQAAETLRALAPVQESLPPLALQDYLRLQSDVAMANQQWPVANEALQRLGALTPLSALDLEQQATAYYQQGLFAEALKAYEAALVLSPKNASLAYNAGLSAFSAKQWDAAENHYNEALNWQPAFADVHYARALVYEQRKQAPQAIADYERFLSLPQPESLSGEQVLEVKKRVAYLKLQNARPVNAPPINARAQAQPEKNYAKALQASGKQKIVAPLATSNVKKETQMLKPQTAATKQTAQIKKSPVVKTTPAAKQSVALQQPTEDLTLRGNVPMQQATAEGAAEAFMPLLPVNPADVGNTALLEEAAAFDLPQLRPLSQRKSLKVK